MDCKIAEFWISLFLDGQLTNEQKIQLLEHIDKCPDCEAYFNRCIEINNCAEELFQEEASNCDKIKSNIMKELGSTKTSFVKKHGRRKYQICAALLVGVIMISLVSNQSVIASINDWVKSLLIKKPNVVITIKEKDEKSKKEEPYTVGELVRTKHTAFLTEKDVVKNVCNVEKKQCLPKYMPNGYQFEGALYEKYENDYDRVFGIQSNYRRGDQKSFKDDFISIRIEYFKEQITAIGGTRYLYDKDTAKKIKVDSEDGYMIKGEFKPLYKFYTICYTPSNLDYMLEIQYKGPKHSDAIEEELVKIADSFVKQLKTQ